MAYSMAPTSVHMTQGHVPPTFTNGWARGAPCVEEQQTRNWSNCTDHHESAHQIDYYCTCRAKKVERHDKQFPSLSAGCVPQFQIRSGVSGPRPVSFVPGLSPFRYRV